MKATEKYSGGRIRNDVIFTAALLLFFCLLGALLTALAEDGDTVTVKVDQAVFGEYPLFEDRVVEIRAGEALNVLIIEDGKARVESASCPDGICCAHRPISLDGESIICLPNRVVISVSSKNAESPDISV